MKKIILFLVFVCLSMSAYAVTYDLTDGVGLGRSCGSPPTKCVDILDSPYRINLNGQNAYTPLNGSNNYSTDNFKYTLFFQQKYRKATYDLKISNSVAGNSWIWVSYLNYSAAAETWTPVANKYFFFNSSNLSSYVSFPFSVDSDTGIVLVELYSITTGTPRIMIGSGESTVTYSTLEGLSSMVAGSSYQFPSVNYWKPQETYIWDNMNDETVFYAKNVSGGTSVVNFAGVVYNIFRPSCSSSTFADYPYIVNNANSSSWSMVQSYYITMNVSEIQELNFTYLFPSGNGSTISVSPNTLVNFSVGVNQPAAISGIAWYVNGGKPVSLSSSSLNSSFSYLFSSPGTYIVSVQLEDTSCNRYPTASWTVVVGSSISLSGTVYGKPLNGVTAVLPGADISLSCLNQTLFSQTASNLTGAYLISGLVPGTYDLKISKSGYIEYSNTITLSNGAYVLDTTLNESAGYATMAVSVQDALTFADIYNYSLNLYWGSALVASIANGSVSYSAYSSLFNVTTSALSNLVIFHNVPMSYNYTLSVSKNGYVNPAGGYIVSKSFYLSSSDVLETLYLQEAGDAYNQTNSTRLYISFPNRVTVGDVVVFSASYLFNGVSISGARCYFSGDSAVSPSSGDLSESGGAYLSYLQIGSSTGSHSLSVTCLKSGYDSLTVGKNFTVYSVSSAATDIEWVLSPTSASLNSVAGFRVKFVDSLNQGIDDGSCNLSINGSKVSMTNVGAGGYYYSYLASVRGVLSYFVSCSKSGYSASTTSTKYLSVGNQSIQPVGHCVNQVKDYDESAVDCGGSECVGCAIGKTCRVNRDCVANYCLKGVCSAPSCSDGVMNGDETGVDCGGACVVEGKRCFCGVNWECSGLGVESCVNNSCVIDNCSVSSPCSSIWWYSAQAGLYVVDRFCYGGKCYFLNQNSSSSNGSSAFNSLIVSPLSAFSMNESNRTIYVSNCEDKSNGFRVSSSVPSTKYYSFSSSGFSPSVPVSSSVVAFGGTLSSTVTQVVPELCLIPSSSSYLYSLLTFQAVVNGSNRAVSVYTLTFREKFKFNVSYGTSGGLDSFYLNATRVMSCKYRPLNSEWVNVSGASTVLVIQNISSSKHYEFACNSSYGEVAVVSYGAGGRMFGFASLIAEFIVTLFAGAFAALFGVEFVWNSWYILPVAILVCLGIPTFAIVGYYLVRKKDKA